MASAFHYNPPPQKNAKLKFFYLLVWVPCVLDDGHDVGPLLGHVDEVASGAVRELDCVDHALGAHDVGDVGDGGAGGRAQI